MKGYLEKIIAMQVQATCLKKLDRKFQCDDIYSIVNRMEIDLDISQGYLLNFLRYGLIIEFLPGTSKINIYSNKEQTQLDFHRNNILNILNYLEFNSLEKEKISKLIRKIEPEF